jgi:hypothetical protein
MPADFVPLLQNPALFKAALAFNGLDHPDAPRDKHDRALPGDLAARLTRTRVWRCRRRLHRENEALWCFAPPENRLALLPFAALEKLLRGWNALVLANLLRQTIDGRHLARLKGALGEEACRHALSQGWRLPESLRAELSPPSLSPHTPPEAGQLRLPGRQLFALCLALWPDTLQVAWRQRHTGENSPWIGPPERILREFAEPRLAAASFQRLWPHLKLLLCTEAAPEWEPCFSS